MAEVVDKSTPEQEHAFHYYTGNEIPWFVRVAWLVFWIFAVSYFIVWLLPAIQSELMPPR